jgi:hypothetical protein
MRLVTSTIIAEATSGSREKILELRCLRWMECTHGTRLSRDGRWLVYALVPQDGDGELVAHDLKTEIERRHPQGKSTIE